jgi:hypothetical protein
MVRAMDAKGWKRLTFDPFRAPDKVLLSHAREKGEQWSEVVDLDYRRSYTWRETWEDNDRNVVDYTFRTENMDTIDRECALSVDAVYFSRDDFAAFMDAFSKATKERDTRIREKAAP